MANTTLFSGLTRRLPRANTRNEAGGLAYRLAPEHALAQLAATGCFNGTYYTSAGAQLDQLQELAGQVQDNLFLARLAVYARERAYMRDMPVALAAILAGRDLELFHRVFDRVVDNGRQLRTLLQMIRSGQFGRRSLSYSLQRAFQRWLNQASVGQLLSASIGNDPSLRDVLRLARPTPADNTRRALFGWLAGREPAVWAPATEADLPEQVRSLIRFRQTENVDEQLQILERLRVRWDLLADSAQGPQVWRAIARQMRAQALRMNLNTLVRHQVFEDTPEREMVDDVARRIANPEEIRRSRQFPYQFLAAYLNVCAEVPQAIRAALCEAAEIACGNVPELPGPVVIGLDTSASMESPATGWRGRGSTSQMRCVDVAALFAAAILRRNPDSVVIPFDHRVHQAQFDPQDSILSLAQRLAEYGGGGTDCSLPLAEANRRYRDRPFVGCVLVSDNESWVDTALGHARYGSTGVMTEWTEFVRNQARLRGRTLPDPRLVCIDIQPYGTVQAPERGDILNIGGFSDAVFSVVAAFLRGDAGHFVAEVEAVEL